MASFAFDFGKMVPWWDNFAGHMNTIMESKATEARAQPFRTEVSWQEWVKRKREEDRRTAAESKERIRASEAARALNERLYRDAEKQRQRAYMEKQMAATARAAKGLPAGMDSAYGGSSPGGVEGAKLSASTIPPYSQPSYVPFAPPAYGPVKGAAPTTNVNVSGGGGSPISFSAMGGGNSIGGFGSGNYWNTPSYWDTDTTGGYEDEEKRSRYGSLRR